MKCIQLHASSEAEAAEMGKIICTLLDTEKEEYESYVGASVAPGIYDVYFVNKEV